MSDLSDYILTERLGQIAQSTRSIESAVEKLQATVDKNGEVIRMDGPLLKQVHAALIELTTWAQRLAVLSCLWAAAVGLNIAPDRVAELLAALLKSHK